MRIQQFVFGNVSLKNEGELYKDKFDDILKAVMMAIRTTITEAFQNIKAQARISKNKEGDKTIYFAVRYEDVDKDKDIFNEIRLKFEIDTESQNFGIYEFKFKELPSPHKIRLFDQESLFNDVICDILNQKSNYKVSGRILYDFAYYVGKKKKINLFSINEKLIEMEVISEDESLNLEGLKDMLIKKFERINYINAKKDVSSLVENESELDVWDEKYFVELTEKIKED